MGKQWTKEETVTLGKLRRSGTSYRAIGEVLGRTTGSCQQQAFKMGICKPHRKAQPERQLEMDLQVAPATETEFRESPKRRELPTYIDEVTQVPADYVFDNRPKPKPTWWSAMMWWRK